MNDEDFRGQSLLFVRTLTNQDPVYRSAREAMQESDVKPGPPPIGAYVWYECEPWGDIGLSLGNDWVLVLNPMGQPIVKRYNKHYFEYLGWSHHIGPLPETKYGPGDVVREKMSGHLYYILLEGYALHGQTHFNPSRPFTSRDFELVQTGRR